MSLGVIISRCQPLHKGHIEMINKALNENDKVLFIIGSANKFGTSRNPFKVDYRVDMLELALDFVTDKSRVEYMTLNDWSSDSEIPKQDNTNNSVDDASLVSKEWGMYLYYSIVAKTGEKKFTLYYNDDSSLVSAWFPTNIRNRLTVKSIKRIGDYSSSAVRKALLDLNMDYLYESLPYLDKEQILKLRYCLTTRKWGSLHD